MNNLELGSIAYDNGVTKRHRHHYRIDAMITAVVLLVMDAKVEVDLTRGLDDLPRHKRTLLLEIGGGVVEEALARLAVKQLDSTGEHVNVLVGLAGLATAALLDLEDEQRRVRLD